MEIAKTINDFIDLKRKINTGCYFRQYIGFETENGRRLITQFKKNGSLEDCEYAVLNENLYILEDMYGNFKYKTPFEIVGERIKKIQGEMK